MKRREGFSLLECVSTVAVIAILFSLLLTGIQSAREKSQQTTCISNAKNLMDAVIQYALDHEKYPTELASLKPYRRPKGMGSDLSFVAYADSLSMGSTDPSSESGAISIGPPPATPAVGPKEISLYYDNITDILLCPKDETTDVSSNEVSYGINEYIAGDNLSSVQEPSRIMALAESDVYKIHTVHDLVQRHTSGVVAGFPDGHVATVKLEYFQDVPGGGVVVVENLSSPEVQNGTGLSQGPNDGSE